MWHTWHRLVMPAHSLSNKCKRTTGADAVMRTLRLQTYPALPDFKGRRNYSSTAADVFTGRMQAQCEADIEGSHTSVGTRIAVAVVACPVSLRRHGLQ